MVAFQTCAQKMSAPGIRISIYLLHISSAIVLDRRKYTRDKNTAKLKVGGVYVSMF